MTTSSRPRTELQTVQVHGHEVAYRAGGDGPLVLLVHGMAGSSAMWEPAIPFLEPHLSYLAPDLPGHGRSAKPRSDYSLGAQASFLRDLMVTLGHDRATIVGQSLGGGIALQFAYQYPERCERLVLVCAGGLGEEVTPLLRALTLPGVDMVLPLAFQPVYRSVVDGVVGLMARVGLQPTPVARETWRSYCSLIDPETRRAFLATRNSVVDLQGQRISAKDRLYLASSLPTQIVWGDNDRVLHPSGAGILDKLLANVETHVMKRMGHCPMLERPAETAELFLKFQRAA